MEFPPKRILVPVDLTAVSLAAWQEADGLASRFGGAAEALYVREWLPFPLEYPARRLSASMKRSLRAELLSRLGPRAKLHMLDGDLLRQIRSWANGRGFDLIVMGSHGRDAMAAALVGSETMRVLAHSKIPLLVCR